MRARLTPMIRVPDLRATMSWYQALGFTVVDTHQDHGQLDWALLSFGEGRVMFNAGGVASAEPRREVDLYIHADDVDGIYDEMKARVDVRAAPHDTFYGMHEFILRDLNGFWITFGQRAAQAPRPEPELPATD